jgi:ATP-dependent Lon protease
MCASLTDAVSGKSEQRPTNVPEALLRSEERPPIYRRMTRFLPILPLRDIVVFPHRIVPLFVGREKSVAALEAAMAADKELFLVAQLDPGEDDPDRDALYDLGVVATAMQLLKLPDGTVRVLVEGVKRARLVDLVDRDGYMGAEIEEVEEEGADGPEAQALMRSVIDQFENYANLNKRLPPETGIQLSEIEDPSVLADAVASNLSI